MYFYWVPSMFYCFGVPMATITTYFCYANLCMVLHSGSMVSNIETESTVFVLFQLSDRSEFKVIFFRLEEGALIMF